MAKWTLTIAPPAPPAPETHEARIIASAEQVAYEAALAIRQASAQPVEVVRPEEARE